MLLFWACAVGHCEWQGVSSLSSCLESCCSWLQHEGVAFSVVYLLLDVMLYYSAV